MTSRCYCNNDEYNVTEKKTINFVFAYYFRKKVSIYSSVYRHAYTLGQRATAPKPQPCTHM